MRQKMNFRKSSVTAVVLGLAIGSPACGGTSTSDGAAGAGSGSGATGGGHKGGSGGTSASGSSGSGTNGSSTPGPKFTGGGTQYLPLTPGCGPETAAECTGACEAHASADPTAVIRPPATLCFSG